MSRACAQAVQCACARHSLPGASRLLNRASPTHLSTQPLTHKPHTNPTQTSTYRYRVGEARFMSDLISTLGILRDHLMTEATNAKHRVNVSCTPTSASLSHSMALVWPQV